MLHIFHFLQTGMVFENVNPFSWIFNAISREKSCLISMPFLTCLLDVRTLEFFPPAESWLVYFNFPRASRMQGGSPASKNIIHQIFSLARDWSKRITWVNIPQLKLGNIQDYYMASSTSGQDESNPALWLATRAGKMELSCPLGTTSRVPQEKFPPKPYNKSFIDQVFSVKMAGYWPRSFFASLWTSTASRSINTQKKLGNIREYSSIFKTACVVKKIWRIIKTIASIWGENM